MSGPRQNEKSSSSVDVLKTLAESQPRLANISTSEVEEMVDFKKLQTHAKGRVREAELESESAEAELKKLIENHSARLERDDPNYKDKCETLVKLKHELDENSRDRENLLSLPDDDGNRDLPTDEEKLQKYYELEERYSVLAEELIPPAQDVVDGILKQELKEQGDIIAAERKIAEASKKVIAAKTKSGGVRTVNATLSEKNKLLVLEEIKHLSLDGKIEHLNFVKYNLISMCQIGLLDESNLGFIIQDKSVDKSSASRLTGAGLGTLNKTDVQKRWGWSCVAIEAHISLELQKPDVNLKKLFEYASNKRMLIAEMENSGKVGTFGLRRDARGFDWYSNQEGKGVANCEIFPGLVELIDEQKDSIKFIKTTSRTMSTNIYSVRISKDQNVIHQECAIGNISSISNCALPALTLGISCNDAGKIEFISTTVDLLKDLDASVNALGEHYLPLLTRKNISQDELLKNLGELVFHLARLYPLARGSGAVIECLARGILKNHYPDIEFGNLKLGHKHDIPYDICAHFVQDPKLYADKFATSIAKKINEETLKPVSVEHGAVPTQNEKNKDTNGPKFR